MTPSNPNNQQPLIYRICDAAGVFHLVAPVDHHHSLDEIAGLIAALAAKANASDVQTALEGKQNTLIFDTSPTANSTNPVTSGGVKAALDAKANASNMQTALAAKMSNTELSIGFEYDSTSGELSHYSDNILSKLTEGKINPAIVEIFSNQGHGTLGKTLALVKWNHSVTNIFKVISIYLNDATYEIRYKNEDGTWGVLTKAYSSITSLLPE